MELYVGYAERRDAGPDVDAPARAEATGPAAAHGVAKGSPVAICGASVDRTGGEPWPPASGAVCPRCEETAKGYL